MAQDDNTNSAAMTSTSAWIMSEGLCVPGTYGSGGGQRPSLGYALGGQSRIGSLTSAPGDLELNAPVQRIARIVRPRADEVLPKAHARRPDARR